MSAINEIPAEIDLQLYVKAEQGDAQARYKLKSLANKGCVSSVGWSPIQFAAANGFIEVVTMLARERRKGVNKREEEDGWTLLHWAAFNGHLEVVSVLVHEFEADVNAKDFFGRSPFHIAAGRGNLKVVQALSSVRAIDMNLTDLLDSTPLHESAKNGWFEAARALVGFGANVNAKDIYGATALHYAVKRRHPDTVKILVEDGKADQYAKDNYGLTPQHWAVSDGDVEMVKAFQEKFSGDAWALPNTVMLTLFLCSLEGSGSVRLPSTVRASHHFTEQLKSDTSRWQDYLCRNSEQT
jgi:ankyrin repeat protein